MEETIIYFINNGGYNLMVDSNTIMVLLLHGNENGVEWEWVGNGNC